MFKLTSFFEVPHLTISLTLLMLLIAPLRAVTTPLKTPFTLIRMVVDMKVSGHLLNVTPLLYLLLSRS